MRAIVIQSSATPRIWWSRNSRTPNQSPAMSSSGSRRSGKPRRDAHATERMGRGRGGQRHRMCRPRQILPRRRIRGDIKTNPAPRAEHRAAVVVQINEMTVALGS